MLARLRQRGSAVLTSIRRLPVLRSFTQLGWIVVGASVFAWFGAWQLGWDELAVVAAIGGILVIGSAIAALGSVSLDVSLELQPKRLTVGSRAAGQFVVRNASGRRLLPTRVELPVGAGRGEFLLPSLGPGASHDELFTIPADRRCVVPVGPVLTVKGDPLGLCRMERRWTKIEELFVHPELATLDRLGSGFLKDLEGQTTNDLSVSDIAFHTLREYAPGDDRRHVHWKTSAKLGTLMVRQYVDTRRSHLAVVLSADPLEYANADEFELAVSLAGSLAVRTIRDEQSVSMNVGAQVVPSGNWQALLDGLSRIEFGQEGSSLFGGCVTASRDSTQASIVALVVGSSLPLPDVRAAATRLGTDARVVVLRADSEGELSYRSIGTVALINIPTLDDFARGLWRASHV